MNQVIYIIDDDETVLDATSMLVRSMGFSTETFFSAIEFLEQLEWSWHGCIILDVRMPGMSGLDLQKELIDRKCELPIIFISGHGDVPIAVQAMRLGAVDFLEKPYNDQQLLDNINRALEIDQKRVEETLRHQDVSKKMKSLTAREREVMERIVAGDANKTIAADLGISERTIEIHRSRVMSKMGCKSLAALVTLVNQAASA